MPDKSTINDSSNEIEPLGSRQLLFQAWDLVLENYWTIAIAILTHGLRNTALAALIMLILIKNPICPIVVLTVWILANAVSFLESPRICLSIVRGEPVALWTKPDLRVLASWLLATLCVIASLFTGLTLFVIPGLLVAMFSSFYGFAIVDGESTIQSIKTSFSMTRKSIWRIIKICAMCLIPMALMPLPLIGLDLLIDSVLLIALAITYNTSRQQLAVTSGGPINDK